MKLSDLRTAAEIHAESMRDPEYAAEYEKLIAEETEQSELPRDEPLSDRAARRGGRE